MLLERLDFGVAFAHPRDGCDTRQCPQFDSADLSPVLLGFVQIDRLKEWRAEPDEACSQTRRRATHRYDRTWIEYGGTAVSFPERGAIGVDFAAVAPEKLLG